MSVFFYLLGVYFDYQVWELSVGGLITGELRGEGLRYVYFSSSLL